MADAPAPAPAPAPADAAKAKDALYAMDEAAIDEVRKNKLWTKDPNYFTKALISPAASMKMLMHTHQGCEAGMAQGGKPLEVMGMLLGYPSADQPKALVVTDVFPLPVTGFETSVVADDESVVNYMIKLSDMIEVTRKERLMGWYHSHPFDVEESHNHCFLSSTDLSTQLSWQRAEDPQGNPFLAIVIDPLRSFAKNTAELSAFRAYPPEFAPPAHQTPNFEIVQDDAKRVEVWGSCWARYYELEVEYFMSSQAKAIVNILNRSHLWARTLSSTPMLEAEARQSALNRVAAVTEKLDRAQARGAQPARGGGAYAFPGEALGVAAPDKGKESRLGKAAEAASGIATERLHGQMTQLTKRHLFCGTPGCVCAVFGRATDDFLARKSAG